MGDKATEELIVVGVLSSAEPLSYTTFLLTLLHLTHSGTGQRILPFLISPRNSPLAVAYLITAKKAKYLWANGEQTQVKTLANEATTHLEQGNTPSIISFPTFADLYSPRDASLHYTKIQDSHATVVFSVPSFLEAWADDRKNVKVLKKMKVIYWGGGPLSERTGRFLHQDVNIVTIYGATKFGAASEIDAKHHEEGYEWFRFPSNVFPALPSDVTEDPDTYELLFKQCETHHLSAINMEIDG
ncbi:hypothetical protein M422DRAFT_276487 [Sphaerobolus stellatus SS14]|uniref:AMP-dependent synthetase/ligase domain-containing protein n=1 Tax=Sphaerobolus stellatus (strain SS14) TaxID=990650 RepID=A0A0C9UD59_SPHS4|nr:hypothetical protein M422DRAFT_276487 [Sphaerobolus stellatus SS14]